MSGILRFIFYFVLFLIFYRLLRSALTYLFGSKRGIKTNQPNKKKSKFEDVEEAKYIEIKPEDEKEN